MITANITQNLGVMVGIAIDGVQIMPSVSNSTKMDVAFPRFWEGAKYNFTFLDFDTCMGSVDPETKIYSYRMLPTCLTQDFSGTVGLCKSSADCFKDIKSFALNKL